MGVWKNKCVGMWGEVKRDVGSVLECEERWGVWEKVKRGVVEVQGFGGR